MNPGKSDAHCPWQLAPKRSSLVFLFTYFVSLSLPLSPLTFTSFSPSLLSLSYRHYSLDAYLPFRLQPDSIARKRCLRARVIRSLFHLYEPFSSRVSLSPALPESPPTTLLNSKVKNQDGNRLAVVPYGMVCGVF